MIEIMSVRAAPFEAVVDFFRAIDSPEIKAHFHPHDFGESRARWLCSYSGKDEYYFVTRESAIVAYGMLRGWDEGYDVPSLGVCVRPGYDRKGLGLALTYHLVAAARLRGAKKMILKVKRDNPGAIAMYRK